MDIEKIFKDAVAAAVSESVKKENNGGQGNSSSIFSSQSILHGMHPQKTIAVLQRGWVIVGDLFKDGEYYTLANAAVIRRWGTSDGLGQIAKNGPTDETILDSCPDIRFHELTSVFLMDCVASEWQ